jgi:hypothetical protein
VLTRIMFISNIRGREELIPYIIHSIIKKHVDLLVFTGNTVSPIIIYNLAKYFPDRIYGITGNLDEPALIKALKDVNGFIEGKIVSFKNIVLASIGSIIDTSMNNLLKYNGVVDILITFYPSRRYIIGDSGYLDVVDYLIDHLRPRIVIIGNGFHKCFIINNSVVYTGYGFKGYYVIVGIDKDINNYFIECGNLYDDLWRLSI